MSDQNLFVTDMDEILDILDDAKRVLLYDTVAVSSHKLSYLRSGRLLLPFFGREGDVVLITETVRKELEEGDGSGEYRQYLQHFAPVLVVRESELIQILEQDYHPQHARKKLKEACLDAFSTIQPLHKGVQELELPRFEVRALDQFDSLFASHNNANKGEYSLLWLSAVLRKRPIHDLEIRFLGMDQDLFAIVERCYFTPEKMLDAAHAHARIDIVSTETMLQGVYRLNGSAVQLIDFTEAFRLDQQRRVWVRENDGGILARLPVRKTMINEEFSHDVIHHQIEVVY